MEKSIMNNNVTIRIDDEVKKEANRLFNDLGLSLNQAINIFLRQCIREQRIPFSIRKVPNAETMKAIEEGRYAEVHPEEYRSFSSVEELMKDLETD